MSYSKVLAALLLSFASTAFAKTLVISDIDDTIRITHVRSGLRSVGRTATPLGCQTFNSVVKNIVFDDMAPLYRTITQAAVNDGDLDEDVEVHYVSNAPTILGWLLCNHAAFLKAFEFPFADAQHLHMREGGLNNDPEAKRKHKVNTITALIEEELAHPSDNKVLQVIMLGDNGEQDPIVYDEIAQKFDPVRVHIKTFIRNIYGRANGTPLVQGSGANQHQMEFTYSAEVAAHLVQDGILTVDGGDIKSELTTNYFEQMATLIVKKKTLLPSWYNCAGHEHTDYTREPMFTRIQPALQIIAQKIEKTCRMKEIQ